MKNTLKKQQENRDQVIADLVAKTNAELRLAERQPAKSRAWSDPKGFQYLGVWQNAALLRVLIRKFTNTLPLNTLNSGGKPLEYRLKAQLDDAARSVKRNIEEGYRRASTEEYIQFLSYSQGSLEEVRGDIRDSKTDSFLPSIPGSSLKGIGIDLRVFKGPGKGQSYGEPTEPGHPYCQPLNSLNSKTLTFEILIELINLPASPDGSASGRRGKTDFLLRKLVLSLENKHERVKLAVAGYRP